jgi:hypothetical protein
MRTIEELVSIITAYREAGYRYADIAGLFPGTSPAVIWKIEHKGYVPKSNSVRRALGMTELITYEVERNGEGRFTKRGPART